MKLTKTIQTVALASLLALSPAEMMAAQKGGTFTTGDKTFLLNGKPFVVKAAELHYPRIPRAYWEHRIKMCKALGMNTVCLYVFWNIHKRRAVVKYIILQPLAFKKQDRRCSLWLKEE